MTGDVGRSGMLVGWVMINCILLRHPDAIQDAKPSITLSFCGTAMETGDPSID